ncbi:MAG: phosphoglycerate dehydrogenase [Bacteroidota bacterium]|jgi:D-3-phosphoglycerate dehydrogenase|nr:phosphoglycerate dehydrogenase [Ignavibacteria bacterium]MCU7498255.1 phosphoglycerate dehydrogenase [Ignavibacteria bacterium]MCU7511253.1 phosphoglycerate dehydrogenase [Ignavibacteria bacterium]MCU7519025.1 phosphoglycerate dehydrogenase [Ignavibacteria bacterium]MCU7523306.1 phosphoglycerate dehydrogenase [Ignavibacteria bacterium]
MKALLLENIHPCANEVLKKRGVEVETHKGSLSEDELIEALQGVSLLGIRSRTYLTKKVFENAPDLLAAGAYCIGTNQIDLDSASKKGVAVFNAPYSNTRSVAEIVIAEIIILIRRLHDKIVKAHEGIWDKSAENAREVRGKKLGIIGYGNIGSQVSMLAEAMGMDVYYYDVVDKLTIGNATRMSFLEDMLRIVDVVTVHVDGNPANRNLIGEKEFEIMKDGVILLNLSRGFVVDVEALKENILSGKVAGASLDVFPEEPKDANERFVSPLQHLPNVLLTPHIGGSTEEAQYNIGEFVSSKLLEYVYTGSTFTSVNFPKIQLPSISDVQRLLHVHENVPGVLSQINAIFARNDVNVVSQYLRTNEKIGYVIADVDTKYKDSLFDDLKQVVRTIKVRIL